MPFLDFEQTKRIAMSNTKCSAVQTEVAWEPPFSIPCLHFKKLTLKSRQAEADFFVKWLRLGSCVEVTVLSQCQLPFPRVVFCNVFIYHYRWPKRFPPFLQFVLSKATGFRQRSMVFLLWWSSSSKPELDVKSFWSGEEADGGELDCAKNLSCVASCEII